METRKHKSAFIAFSYQASAEDKDARAGKRRADSVYKLLQKLGLSTTDIYHYEFSQKQLPEDSGANIRSQIREKDALVVIYTKRARESEWVQHEISAAVALEKPIYLLRTPHNIEVELHESISHYLRMEILEKIDELMQHFSGSEMIKKKDAKSLNER